ncbi:MAG: hypothetical protein WDW38_001289 [Sanguina aurantia]
MQLVRGFSLSVSCSTELQLRLDGFTLPSDSSPVDMLREGDLLTVARLASRTARAVGEAAKLQGPGTSTAVANAAQPAKQQQQQANGVQTLTRSEKQLTGAGEGRKQKRKAAAAGLQSTPASPAQRKKGAAQPPSQQQQQQQGDAATAAAAPPTTAAPGADLHGAGAAAAEQTHPSSTAATGVAGPSGPSGLAEPVPSTPALTAAAAAGAAAHDTSGKPTPSRSARRKSAKRLLIRTGVLPHKRKQGSSKAAADKATASQPRAGRPAKQPRVAAANGTAKSQPQPPPPHTASPARPHQPSAMELAAAASPWDPNSSLPTLQPPTQGGPRVSLPQAGAPPTLSNIANKGSAGASTSQAAAAATPIRPTPTTTPAKPSKQAAAAAERSSEEDTSSEEESSSDDEDGGTGKPSGGAAATPAGKAAAPAPTKAAAAAASPSSESEDSDSDDSVSDSDSDGEDDAGTTGGDKGGQELVAAAAAAAAAGQQHRAHSDPPAAVPRVLPGPPLPGGPNNRPHQTGPPRGVATVIGRGPPASSAHHHAPPPPHAGTAQAHHPSRQQQQQQQGQGGAGGGSSYQAHGHDYGAQCSRVAPVRMGWPPAPRAAHPSTLPKVLAGSLRPGDVVAYQLLEIAANFCPQVSAWRHGRVSAEQVPEPAASCSTVTLDPYPDATFHPIQRQLDEWRLQQAADAGAELAGVGDSPQRARLLTPACGVRGRVDEGDLAAGSSGHPPRLPVRHTVTAPVISSSTGSVVLSGCVCVRGCGARLPSSSNLIHSTRSRLARGLESPGGTAGPLDWDALPFETPYQPSGTLLAAADSFVDLRMVEAAPVDPHLASTTPPVSLTAAGGGCSDDTAEGAAVPEHPSTSTEAAAAGAGGAVILPTLGGWSEIHDQLQRRRKEVAAASKAPTPTGAPAPPAAPAATPTAAGQAPAVAMSFIPAVQAPSAPSSSAKKRAAAGAGKRGGTATNGAPPETRAAAEGGGGAEGGVGADAGVNPPPVSGAEVPGVVRARGGLEKVGRRGK